MRLRHHVEDQWYTPTFRVFLELKALVFTLNQRESLLLGALRAGMKFVQADLWARRDQLSLEEQELLAHLSMGFENLKAVVIREMQMDRLTDPRRRIICAAIELGIEDVYHLHWYLKLFGPPLVTEAA